MKNFFIIILFTSINLYSQNQIIGKTFKAQISESCVEFNNGGGAMEYTYCILKFKKKIVLISYNYKSLGTAQRENYNNNSNEELETRYFYKIKNNIISIKGFDTFGKFRIKRKKLIGKKEMNYKEYINLEFIQQ